MHTFCPHGTYALHIEGRILVSHVSGPWNRELIEDYVGAITAMIGKLAGSPWAMRATVTKNGMHTPESYAGLVEGIRRQRPLGRVATAVILCDVEAPTIVRSVLEKMYIEAEEPHAFFDDETSANAWLADRLGS